MLTLLPTPIGNLEDITYRTIEAIKKADLILSEDTRVTKRLLFLLHERLGISFAQKDFVSFNEHNGDKKIESLLNTLREKNCVYMSDAGMPAISDPGQLLVESCQKHSIDYDVFPGASAVVTAYAASGFESGKFLFYGFLPHKGRDREEAFHLIINSGWDTVLYESPHRLLKLLEEISSYDGDREIFCAKEISKLHQAFFRGKASQIFADISKSGDIKGEWAVIVSAKTEEKSSISIDEILKADIPPKAKSKLLSQITGESVKEWYQKLIN